MNKMASMLSAGFIFGFFISLSVACRPGWLQHGDSCYHFSHDLETWSTANYNCHLFGGYLVEIDSAEENHFVSSQTQLLGASGEGRYWIGLNDLEEEGTFVWMHSQVTLDDSVSFWYPGQPDNSGQNQNCVHYASGSSKWLDGTCGYAPGLKYICEQPVSGSETVIG